MQAGFREKTSPALPGILIHLTGQVSACTVLWNQRAVLDCGVGPDQEGQLRHQHQASGAKGKLGDDFYPYQTVNPNLIAK